MECTARQDSRPVRGHVLRRVVTASRLQSPQARTKAIQSRIDASINVSLIWTSCRREVRFESGRMMDRSIFVKMDV